MSRSDHRSQRTYLVLFLTLVAVITGWVLVAGNVHLSGLITTVQSALHKPRDSAQLISYDPLPAGAMDDDNCELVPVNASSALAADPLQAGGPNGPTARSSEETAPGDASGKKPVRMIRDRYASYSSVAVDPTNNEVIVTDENLFNVLVYNRLDNTPPTSITEPKRSIGGLKTKIEFQSGVYVDPKNGDIYAVNNDTVDTLVIFSREAKGDVRPVREVHTPHGTFGIAVDEERQEVLLTVQHDSAVVTFEKTATSEDAPIRLLQGEHTLLADPHGMALDAKDDLIFVTNHGSVHQFAPVLWPPVNNPAKRSSQIELAFGIQQRHSRFRQDLPSFYYGLRSNREWRHRPASCYSRPQNSNELADGNCLDPAARAVRR